MSGLLALLDDVAAIAKVAATSLDDVIAQAAKAGTKAAGAVIDDAAVTPKYVQGFSPARELPIVGRIALGSIKNKLVFLLPAALALSAFAPGAIAPLLMLGGAYLCFEGAEKIAHVIWPHPTIAEAGPVEDPAHLEEAKIAGAIKTDFILSAEIMTIALAAIPESGFWMEAATLAIVAVGITVVVYGGVALIVKMDDLGLLMSKKGRLGLTRALGRALVKGMPGFLRLLATVGTAAMLWVGGSILVHGFKELGFPMLEHVIHDWSLVAGNAVPDAKGFVTWFAKAAMDGVFGLVVGLALIPIGTKLVAPIWAATLGKAKI
jgi:predicted DNA repair protein MutK